MTEVTARESGRPSRYGPPTQPATLADILERVLDKGIVIAGDIKVNLLDIELLTVKIRLLVASVDKAAEMGIDWWRDDPSLSSSARENGNRELERENRRLRRQVEELRAGREDGGEEPEARRDGGEKLEARRDGGDG